MKSVSSSSCSGSSSRSKQTGGSSSCSVHTSRSVDVEVMKIQDRLIFPPNVPVSAASYFDTIILPVLNFSSIVVELTVGCKKLICFGHILKRKF